MNLKPMALLLAGKMRAPKAVTIAAAKDAGPRPGRAFAQVMDDKKKNVDRGQPAAAPTVPAGKAANIDIRTSDRLPPTMKLVLSPIASRRGEEPPSAGRAENEAENIEEAGNAEGVEDVEQPPSPLSLPPLAALPPPQPVRAEEAPEPREPLSQPEPPLPRLRSTRSDPVPMTEPSRHADRDAGALELPRQPDRDIRALELPHQDFKVVSLETFSPPLSAPLSSPATPGAAETPPGRVEPAPPVTFTRAAQAALPDLRVLKIRLEPAHLGELTLSLKLKGAELTVNIEATPASALDIIRNDEAVLRKVLREAGYDPANLTIAVTAMVKDGITPSAVAPSDNSGAPFQSSLGGGRGGDASPSNDGERRSSFARHDEGRRNHDDPPKHAPRHDRRADDIFL